MRISLPSYRSGGHQEYAVLRTWLLVKHIHEAASKFDSTGRKVGNTAFLQELEAVCGVQNLTCSTQLLSKPSIKAIFKRLKIGVNHRYRYFLV
jgi:hypothetical protein